MQKARAEDNYGSDKKIKKQARDDAHLIVVVLMTVLLGFAVPNLLAEVRQMRMVEMNSNARAVAVAVQSRLYGMRNAGTTSTSDYGLVSSGVKEVEVGNGSDLEKARYFSNFDMNGETGPEAVNSVTFGKQILSGALTDTELLKEDCYIVVVFRPETADVLEVFFSENPIEPGGIFPAPSVRYLEKNYVGLYRGEGAPEPEEGIVMPTFRCDWVWDDELRLEISMGNGPLDPELAEMPLGLEIYVQIPNQKEPEDPWKNPWEIGIYYEGIFTSEVTTSGGKIVPDSAYPLTLSKIRENNNKMSFSIDSMIVDLSPSNTIQSELRRSQDPEYISVAKDELYARESLTTLVQRIQKSLHHHLVPESGRVDHRWDPFRRARPRSVQSRSGLCAGQKKILDFVKVTELFSLRGGELHVLSATETETLEGGPTIKQYDDDYCEPVRFESEKVSPYYFLLDQSGTKIELSSMRDLKNLCFIFQTQNDVNTASLSSDITGDQFYYHLAKVREELAKAKGIDTNNTDQMIIMSKKRCF